MDDGWWARYGHDRRMTLDDDQRRTIATDWFLGVGMFLLSIGAALVWNGDPGGEVRPADLGMFLVIGGQTLPLIWRRQAPIPVLSVIITTFVIDTALGYQSTWAFFGMAFVFYTIGAQLTPRRSLLVGGLALDIVLLWTTVGVFVSDIEPFIIVQELAVLGFPLLVGRESYHRQQRILELESRAIRAEHEREQRALDAVVNERVRIARELHDVVAHEITVMTLQTAGARRIVDDDRGRAVEAMEAVEEAGHRALTEMRRLLGMLRTADPKATAPQPGLDALEPLVEQMKMAGLDTKLSIVGESRALPVGIDLNAYRIIQESLTNTLKHGGPDVRAEIRVTYDDRMLSVDVTDNGRGAAATHSGPAGSGQGLVGMHERIALLKGTMSAGPKPGGGYRISAQIPIPA